MLSRKLSAALQEKASIILTPMFADVSNVKSSSLKELNNAKYELDLAAELLGKEHFLYNNLQARSLFLKALIVMLNDDTKIKLNECIHLLEQSIMLEPTAAYTYFYLSSLYAEENINQKAEVNIKKYLDLIPFSSWVITIMAFCFLV